MNTFFTKYSKKEKKMKEKYQNLRKVAERFTVCI